MTQATPITLSRMLRSLSTKLDRHQAQDILLHCLGKPNQFGFLISHGTALLTAAQQQVCEDILRRRLAGEPLAYIIGQCYFYDMSLHIDRHCLIPRPDTEVLVDTARDLLQQLSIEPKNKISCLDLGTGPGSVILALKHQYPAIDAFGSDFSLEALHCAQANGLRLQLDVSWVHAHWCEGFKPSSFSLIVSNPPYIADAERPLMNSETDYEPDHALFSEEGGMQDIAIIIKQSPRLLKPKGWLVLEHGYTQAPLVAQHLEQAGFVNIESRLDLQSHPRVTFGQLPLESVRC